MKIINLFILSGLVLCISCTSQSAFDLKDTGPTLDTIQSQSTVEELLAEEKYTSKDFAEIGFELLNNESFGEIKIGLSANKILELLGKPDIKSKMEYWGADGLFHQSWSYQKLGIDLNFSSKGNENQELFSITITEPCSLSTKRKIGIGSTFEDVKIAYHKAIDIESSDSVQLVAGSYYGGIIFTFKNNLVESIFIGAAAE